MVDRRLIYYYIYMYVYRVRLGVRVIKNINQKYMLRICNSFLLKFTIILKKCMYMVQKRFLSLHRKNVKSVCVKVLSSSSSSKVSQ